MSSCCTTNNRNWSYEETVMKPHKYTPCTQTLGTCTHPWFEMQQIQTMDWSGNVTSRGKNRPEGEWFRSSWKQSDLRHYVMPRVSGSTHRSWPSCDHVVVLSEPWWLGRQHWAPLPHEPGGSERPASLWSSAPSTRPWSWRCHHQPSWVTVIRKQRILPIPIANAGNV